MKSRLFLFLVSGFWLLVTLTGCAPTYPKEKFKESIARLCKDEYKLDVKVETAGKTIAIYLPLEDLIDFTFAITQSASEKINDVILSVSRVALSTDAQYDFYCIIAHDVRIPEIQMVIIKSVDDVKRFLLNDISRGEYFKRILVDMRFSPQARKEKAIKDIFEKMSVDKKWQEGVMNDFFRSEPTVLGDIGYWNDHFYIKDVSLSEFLAEQIANRVKIAFREQKTLANSFLLKTSRGTYAGAGENRRGFLFEVAAEQLPSKDVFKDNPSHMIFAVALKEAGQVLHSYGFRDFDYVEAADLVRYASLRVSPQDLELYRKNRLTLQDLIQKQL